MGNGDHYEVYYADKLWQLVPAIYRSLDSNSFDRNGPLREIVNRIGAQAAILRRSIDRLWEDQSIETCDDWVISYIAGLLATNLVASMDTRAQRLDVFRTIYYRRRKGTLALLEELAADITSWDARVVEFFRRLGRTRHAFDPEIGMPSATDDPLDAARLQVAEGLTGKLTQSGIGGWADLRNVYGASKGNYSAFDEFFHTADFRKGRGMVGWHNIPRLGVFLWRLRSFGVQQSNPVAVRGCPGHYVFDPTGRNVPLFAAASRPFGDQWTSPEEWQLPTPINQPLLNATLADPAHEPLYAAIDPTDGVSVLPNSLGVFRLPGTFYNLIPANQLAIHPEGGSFKVLAATPRDHLFGTYYYGFSSTIGAGPYDRRVLKEDPTPTPETIQNVSGGGGALAGPLAAVAPRGTVLLNDFLTYTAVDDVTGIDQVTVVAQNRTRPVVRLPRHQQWKFTGNDGSTLFLDGLLLSGGDVVLQGQFDRVVINCCSFDPGQADEAGTLGQIYEKAADGQELAPSNLWVEAEIACLEVNRSILGPVRSREGGEIETLTITDSIIQAAPAVTSRRFEASGLCNRRLLAIALRDGASPVAAYTRSKLSTATKSGLSSFDDDKEPTPALVAKMADDLNALAQGPLIYDPGLFNGILLSSAILHLIALNPSGASRVRVNRMLLKAALPIELLETSDLALFESNGNACLVRSTILGPASMHSVDVSECILNDVFFVENSQDGCVRFSAWSTGSVLPRKYECVEIPARTQLFTSHSFGQPGYCQLVLGVDRAIVSGEAGASISAGAENGSEMGAFSRELNSIKERSLRIKYEEYMPVGLVPVLIYVT